MNITTEECEKMRESIGTIRTAAILTHIEEQQKRITELKAHVDRLINAEHCPNYKCNDSGCIPVRNTCNGEWEPEQCEFCYCEPDSFFRAKQETPAQSLAHIKRESLQRAMEIVKEETKPLNPVFDQPTLSIITDMGVVLRRLGKFASKQ